MADTRLKPGNVRDAIVTYLRRRSTDATMEQIIKAVEATIGHDVPQSSVRSYLRLNTGESKVFDRTGRGRYRLKP
jgi:hypothetical protein